MAQIPTPPPSRPGSEAPEPEVKPAVASVELTQSLEGLDNLLEQYLHLLDRQQKLQSALAKQLSSGFLSLAHANYTSPPGRRYGADYYDGRMKATRKISIRAESEIDNSPKTTAEYDGADSCQFNDFEYTFDMETVTDQPFEKNSVDSDAKDSISKEAEATEAEVSATDSAESPSETDTPAPQAPKAHPTAAQEKKSAGKKFRSDNPIHWYGILIPPSLRAAQKSFTAAVQTQVPDLAGTVVEMRALEYKITQARIKLGIDASQ